MKPNVATEGGQSELNCSPKIPIKFGETLHQWYGIVYGNIRKDGYKMTLNKKVRFTILYVLYVFSGLLMLNANLPMPVKAVALSYVALSMFIDDRFIVIGLACGNIMPEIYYLRIFTIVLIAIVLKGAFKGLLGFRLFYREKIVIMLLVVLLLWLQLCGFLHEDNELSNTFILNIIFYLCVSYFLKFSKIEITALYESICMGFFIIIVAGLLIKFNIPGFSSNHLWGRLAIGERADANSTGLYAMFFSVAIFLLLATKSERWLWHVCYIGLFLSGVFILFSTGSRGASIVCFLGVLFTILTELVLAATNKRKNRFKFIISLIILGLTVSVLLIRERSYLEQSLSSIVERSDIVQHDGNRPELAIAAIREVTTVDPIFGIGMESYRSLMFNFPHNIFLDYLVAGGYIAFILFCTLGAYVLIVTYKSGVVSGEIEIRYFALLYALTLLNLCNYSSHREKLLYLIMAICIYVTDNTTPKTIGNN